MFFLFCFLKEGDVSVAPKKMQKTDKKQEIEVFYGV